MEDSFESLIILFGLVEEVIGCEWDLTRVGRGGGSRSGSD